MMRGGGRYGWGGMINAPDEKPRVTRHLLRRVLAYAKPYRRQIASMLVIILLSTGLSLLTPLVMRDLIDRTIPSGNVQRLIGLAAVLLVLPILGSMLSIANRRFNVWVGEGVTYDLRVALYARLQPAKRPDPDKLYSHHQHNRSRIFLPRLQLQHRYVRH